MGLCGKQEVFKDQTWRQSKAFLDNHWRQITGPEKGDDGPLMLETRKRIMEFVDEMCDAGFL